MSKNKICIRFNGVNFNIGIRVSAFEELETHLNDEIGKVAKILIEKSKLK